MSAPAFTLNEPEFDECGDSNYWPCSTGLHLCGVAARPGDDYEQPYSALNLCAASEDEARAMFAAAREEAETTDGEHDLICDLTVSDSIVEDFYTNRQMAPRLVAAALRARGESPSTHQDRDNVK